MCIRDRNANGYYPVQVDDQAGIACGMCYTTCPDGVFHTIILPGSTFKSLYKKLNVDMPVLTRTLADSGSAFNAVVPWGVSGTFIVGTLGLKMCIRDRLIHCRKCSPSSPMMSLAV